MVAGHIGGRRRLLQQTQVTRNTEMTGENWTIQRPTIRTDDGLQSGREGETAGGSNVMQDNDDDDDDNM